jgi:hypothetical protein
MSWSAGSGGTPTSYTYIVIINGVTTVTTVTVATTSATYSPMTSGVPYTFCVYATNSAGNSVTSSQSSSRTYTAGAGITISSTNTAANMTAAVNTVSGFAGVDDGFGAVTTNLTMLGTNYTTCYLGTNGYITFTAGSSTYSTSPTASYPNGAVAIHIHAYDARGINATWSQGYSSVTTTAQYTRIVSDWYPYYGVNSGDIQAEIYLVRDVTNSKQFIWIKIGSGYNNNGNPDSTYGITNGSSFISGTTFPGVGGSVVFSSDLNGTTWTTTLPGSLNNF